MKLGAFLFLLAGVILAAHAWGAIEDVLHLFLKCMCPSECDCQNPDDEVAGVSNHCPDHNDNPTPHPECQARHHYNGAE